MRLRTLFFPLLAASLSGCILPKPWAPAPPQLDPPMAATRVEVHEARERPMLSVLAREGDPSPAIALAVVTEGGLPGAVALAAIVESRLEQAGFAHLDSQASWDGYRLTALLPDTGRIAPFVAALRDALLTPLSSGSVELSRAAERLATLEKQPVAEAPTESFWRCTGDPIRFASDARLDLGLAELESLRKASHLASRLSLGVVGPRAVGDEVTRAVASSPRWPDGPGPREAERGLADLHAAVVDSENARLKVALRVSDAVRAKLVAERAFDPTGLLATRLRALGSAWRITEVEAAARARGGCLAMTVEPVMPLPESLVESSSLRAASVLLQELRADLGGTPALPEARDPFRAALDASDPRDASALAAWWALSSRGRGREFEARPSLLAELPRGADRDREARRSRFEAALRSSAEPTRDRVLEPRVRVERGQNRLWLLVASPCGPSAESSADAGLTALAILSAAAAGSRDGVTLEPWLSPEGVGLLAHAAPRSGESPWDLADRVAREAAKALATWTHDPKAFAAARAILLDKLVAQGPALEVAAKALSPAHPSSMTPLGRWNATTRLGPEAAALRAHALVSGPLEIAVLADHHAEQAEIAARTLERWLARGEERPRSCPLRDARSEPTPGLFDVELAPTAPSSRALLAFPLSGPIERELGAWLVAGLEGAEGWLAQALRSLSNTQATARILGGELASALLIDVRAKDELIDDAIAQLRGLVLRLSSGAIGQGDLERALRHRSEAYLESSLDPRRRIVDLFLRRGPLPPQPKLEELQAFAKEALGDHKAILVLARPKP